MTEPRRALVLHLAGRNDPLTVAVPAQDAADLAARLPDLVRRGSFESITMANGDTIVVNFAQVQAALVDTAPGIGRIYGSVPATSNAFSR